MRLLVLNTLLAGIFMFVSVSSFGQAVALNTGTEPRHETPSQRVVSVLFPETMVSADVSGWTVTVNNIPVTVTAAAASGSRVNITFDASPAHAGQSFIIPGDVLRVSYSQATGNTIGSSGEIASFGPYISKNLLTFSCSDLLFYQQGIFPGAVADVCSPVVMNFYQFQYRLSLRMRNSTNFTTALDGLGRTINPNLFYGIAWGDVSTSNERPYISDLLGDPDATFIDPTGFTGGNPSVILTARPSHNYPAANPTDCSFDLSLTPFWNAVATCNGVATTTLFATYDNDNENSGALALEPSVVNSNRVCLGTDVNMMFSDQSDLNCRAEIEATVPNEQVRWLRVTYGYQDAPGPGNIPDIVVDGPLTGGPQTITNSAGVITTPGGYYPTGAGGSGITDIPDANGVIELSTPVSVATATTFMQTITSTSTVNHAIGQRLYVRLEYWNVCNQYDGTPATLGDAVATDNYIEIVTKPDALTTTGASVCYVGNTTGLNFTVAGAVATPSRTAVNWYNTNPKAGGATLMTNPNGTNSLTFPLAAYSVANNAVGAPFLSNNVNGKYYSVWATQVVGGTNSCESDPVEVVIIQLPRIAVAADIPLAPSGATSVCNNNDEVYTTSAPNTKTIAASTATNSAAIDLPTENIWSHTFGAGVSLTPTTGNSTTVTYAFGTEPEPSVTNNVRVRRGYVTTTAIPVVSPLPAPNTLPTYFINPLQCLNSNVNTAVTVFGESDGGTINGSPTICDGESTGNMTATGTRGAIIEWQRQFNGGGFVGIPATAGLTTYSEVPPNGPGTYKYQVLVQNQNITGPCASTTTILANQNTVIVNPVPAKPLITPSGATTFCENSSVTLSSSTASADSYRWYRNGVNTGVTTQTILIDEVSESGTYTVETVGIGPTNCTSPLSDPVDVTVNPLPVVQNPTGGGAVCSGNPAPDIEWVISSGTGPFTVTYTITQNPGNIVSAPFVVGGVTGSFIIDDPNPAGAPGDTFDYKITNIEDASGCFADAAALALVPSRQVSIGGTAPGIDETFSISPEDVCDDGGSTVDPVLDFSLDVNDVGFTLFYRINGILPTRFMTFDTDALGDPTGAGTPIAFTDAELDAVGSHTITIVSILSGAGCQTIVNMPLTFTVNPLPPDPINPVGAVACSSEITGATLSVDDPGAGNLVRWYEDALLTTLATGTPSGLREQNFTPNSNATFTYFAVVESQTAPTNCLSDNSVAVIHTQDLPPTVANAGNATEQTCDTSFPLNANVPNVGLNERGYWTVSNAIYFEGFGSSDNGIGASGPGPVVTLPPSGNWTLDITGGVFGGGEWLRVENGMLEAKHTSGEVSWESSIIDISSSGAVDVSLDIAEVGVMEPSDYIRAFYEVDASGLIPFTNGDITDDNTIEGDDAIRSLTATGLTGNSLRIVVLFNNNALTELHRLDNVRVYPSGNGFPSISDINSPTAIVTNLQVGVNTLTWHIQSEYNVCAETTDNIAITRIALPVGVDITANVCEDLEAQDEKDNIDLTVYNAAVTGGAGSRTVAWFTDAARTAAVADETDVDGVTDGTVFYALITETASGSLCQNLVPGPGSVTFTVDPLPATADITPDECEDALLSGKIDNVDLTTFNADVAATIVANRAVTWWLDPGVAVNDPSDLVTQILTPTDVDNVTDSERFYAVVENTSTNCFNVGSVEFIINPLPQDNPIETPDGTTPATYTICTGSTTLLFQVDRDLNPGSTYIWNIPPQFLTFGGGGVNDFYVLLEFPNQVASPGLPISVTEISADGCTGNTNTMAIIVDDAPPAPVITGDDNVCVNEQSVDYNITLPVGGSTYTWNVPGTLGAIVNGQGTDLIVVNISNTSGNISVVETNAAGCTSPPAVPLNVTVNPKPSMTSATTAEICSDEAVSSALTFASDLDPATIFDWEVVNKVGSVAGASIGNQGTGNISQVLTNTSALTGRVFYEVTPMIDIDPGAGTEFCPGLPAQTVIIDVHPEPVGQAHSISTCSGTPLNYDLQSDNIDALGNNLPSLFTYTAVSSNPGDVPAEAPRVVATNTPIAHNYINPTSVNVTVTYTVTPFYDNGGVFNCEGSSFTVTVTVRPNPEGVDDVKTICSGANVNYMLQNNVNVLGNGLISNFVWEAAPNANVSGLSTSPQAGGTINDILTNVTNTDQVVVYTVTPTGTNGCAGDPFTITVTVQPEPVGSNDTKTVCSDENVNYDLQDNVTNLGNNLAATFTWVATANSNVTGESTSPQLGNVINNILNNVTAVDQFVVYTVTPTSTAGSCAGDPFTVTITVRSEPQGANDVAVTCSDAALTYNLQSNITTLGNGQLATFNWVAAPHANVTGESSSPQSGGTINDVLNNVTGTDQVVVYTVTPTSTTGSCVGNPFTINVTVRSEPVGANDIKTICSDASVNYDLQNNVTSLGNGQNTNFTWVAAPNPDVTGESTGSQAGGTITDLLNNVTNVDQIVVYTVTPTGANGCPGNPFTVSVTVQPEPVGMIDIKTICGNSQVNYDLQDNINTLGNNLAATFTWVATANANVSGESTSSQVSGVINDLLINVTNADENVVYTVTPAGTNGCPGNPFTVTVTVRPQPIGVNDTKTICSDLSANYNLQNNINTIGNALPSNFSWVAASNGNVSGESTSAQGGGIITDVLNNVTGADQNVVYTVTPTSTLGCVGVPFTITITVRSEPVGGADAKTVCSGENISYDLQNNINTLGNSLGSSFSWVAAPNGNVTGESTSPQAGNTINNVIVNTTNVDQIVTYTVTPTGINGCEGNPFTVNVTVRPEPVGVADSKTICSDDPVNYNLSNNVNSLGNNLAATFSWVAASNANVTGENTTPQAGPMITDVLNNVSGIDQAVTYTVTPTSLDGCDGNPFVITVTVQSEPVGLNDVANICSGNNINYALQTNLNTLGNNIVSTFTWIAADNPDISGESTTSQSGSILTDLLNNVTNIDQVVVYTVTPTSVSGCAGSPFTVSVTVRPEPVGAADSKTICSDENVAYDLSNNITTLGNNLASTFTWVAISNGNVTGESTSIQAGTNITDILNNVTSVDQIVVYTVTPTGVNGCAGDPFLISITVQPEPVGLNDVKSICSDGNVSYDLQNNVNSLGNNIGATFSWIAAPNGSITGESTSVQAGNVINDVLNNVSGVDQIVTYTVTPTGVNGCAGNSFTVSITVRPEPLGVDDTKLICSDENIAYDLQNNITGSGNGVISTFAWVAATNTNVSGESITVQAGNIINNVLTNITGTDQVVVYTVTPTGTNGCVGNSFTVTVTVRPEPVGINNAATICSDDAANYDLQDNVTSLGNGVTATFSWVATSNTNVSGESTGAQAGNIITDVLNNITSVVQTVVYTVTPTGTNGCIGNPFTVSINVNPEPVGQNDTELACNVPLSYDIQAANINTFGNGLSSEFTYTVISSDQPNVPAGPDRLTASALPITDSYVNSTGVDVLITYNITPISALTGCAGDPFTYIVTIRSRPVGADYTHTPDVCSGVPLNIDPQTPGITNGVVSTFTWTALYAPGLSGGAPSGTGNITGTLTNTGATPLNAIFTVTPTAGPCDGPSFDITVVIDPQPVTDPSLATRTICSDTETGILLNTNGVSVGANSWDVDVQSISSNLTPHGTNAADPGLSQPAGYIATDQFTNHSFTPGTVVYKVTPIGPPATFCRGVDTFITVTVDPEPVMNPALTTPTIVCSDEVINVALSTNGASVAALSYIYTDLQNPPGTSIPISVGNAIIDPIETGAGDRAATVIQNDRYNNITGAAFDRFYLIKPKSAAGCLGDIINIPVQILPEPDFTLTAAPPVCSDASIDLELAQAGATVIDEYHITSITWDIPPSAPVPGLLPGGANQATGSIVSGPNFTIQDTYTNGTNVALKAYYRVVPVAALVSGKQCVGDEKIEEVDVLPSPIVLDNLDEIVCSNTAGGVVLNTKPTSAAAQSYQIDPITTDPKFGLLTIQVFDATTRVEDGASSNEIQADRFVNPTNDTIKVRYKIRANTNSGGSGCYGPEEIVVVTIEPEIVANVSSTAQICSNGTAEIILSSPTNPSAGDVTFNFTASPSAAGTVSGHSPGSNLDDGTIEQILSNSSNNPVDVTYTVTPRANSAAGGSICVGDPVTTVVSVEPKPRLTVAPATLTVCEGVPLGIDFNTTSRPSTGEASVFFQLTGVEDPNTLAAPANVSGFETTYPANYNSGTDVLNDILVNTALEQQSLRYSFTPSFDITSDICIGDEVSINVTVSPRPTLVPFTVDPHCSAEPFSVDYSASVTESDLSSTLATWSFAYSSPGPGLSGASNGAGFELSQVVFNKTTDPATVTYSIKAKSFNCESNTIQVPVQIYPVPKITDVPNSVNVCDDGTLAVPLNSNATGTQFTWIVDDESQPELTGASDQLTPVNGPINYLVSNSGTSLGNYTFEITPQLSTSVPGKVCVGDPKQMIINVAPPVDGRILTSSGTNESFVCEGSRETILLEFDGLALFEAVYREGLNTITLTGQGPAKQIQITPTATTTFELVSVKDLFGCETTINETVTVNVSDTDATFAIVGPAEACSPHQVSFEHDQQEGVTYTWKWFDGPDSTAYTATADELNKIIKHTFENSSPLTVAKYKVFLETKLADTRYPECLKTSFQEVRVSPNINVGVFPDATEICSGETVAFTNTSRGPSSHRWFYREQGTTQENDVRTTISPSFQLVNNTTQNPIVYEVVYDADNGTCPASTVIPITVYRGVDAAFDEGVIPPYVAGSSTVTFTNTSTPLESSQFTYEWTFGGNSSPEEFSGTDATIPVTYTLPGLKEVTLTVTNTVANASSLTCSDTFSKTIEILLPPLIAAFNASPLAGCFPVDIEITENTSTGDVYKWQVIDQSGNIAATALSPNPIFRIVNPGTYDIFLEASSSVTGQTAFAQKTGIEIFDNPIASLEARPTTLFIPDTELITFNFSTGANFYQWDFDDGTISQDFEPKHFYSLEGTYEITLVAGNDHGERDIDGDGIMDGNVICYDTVKRQVIAKQGGLTKIPNAFTPNANGPGGGGDPGSGSFNDVFLPITKGVAREDGSFVMQIYDRWGTLMFESRNQNQGWNGYDRNGNLVPAGVYVFKLDLRLADGQRITQVGDVTVIR